MTSAARLTRGSGSILVILFTFVHIGFAGRKGICKPCRLAPSPTFGFAVRGIVAGLGAVHLLHAQLRPLVLCTDRSLTGARVAQVLNFVAEVEEAISP